MTIKSIALGLALAVSCALPLHAATFNIAFDSPANGVGDDWFGTFTAPLTGGLLTSFSAMIDGTTYDTLIFTLSYAAFLAPVYDPLTHSIRGQSNSLTVITPDPLGPTQPGLLLANFGPNNNQWGLATCDSVGQCGGHLTGTYTIAAVPVPAALPLLAAGLGALGWVSRRRKKAA